MIFLSKGIAVSERTNHMITHGIRSLDFVIDKYNERLEEGFSLKLAKTMKNIFEQLLKDLSTVLLLADQTFYMPRNRSHIPTWAIAAFGACAGLLIIMALGLILVRRRERGAFKRGQSKDKSDRRWKAGFVGGMYKVPQRQSVGEFRGSGSADYIYSHNVKSTSERRKTLAQA
ncbi:hypothetical protein T09_9364 [Trichinella sp. T9]|nr:hypothetical protein T09_9364 [Trichinella sp. T9]